MSGISNIFAITEEFWCPVDLGGASWLFVFAWNLTSSITNASNLV